MSRELKTATPDTTFDWASAYLFGADSQSASTPSIYAASTILSSVKSIGFAADSTYDIGTDSVRPATVYADTLNATDITLDGGSITNDGNDFTVGSRHVVADFSVGVRGRRGQYHGMEQSRASGLDLGINVGTSSDTSENLTVFKDLNGFGVYNGGAALWDSANYERVEFRWNSNILKIVTEAGGTGSSRMMQIGTTGASDLFFRTTDTNRWTVAAAGSLAPVVDSTYDLGGSARRIRTVYADTLDAPTHSGGTITWGEVSNNSAAFFVHADNSFGYNAAAKRVWLNGSLEFNGGANVAGTTQLHEDASDILALRRDANAQEFRIYNTDDGAGNYERAALKWDSNVLNIGTEAGGTGTQRGVVFNADTLTFSPNGTARWFINATGILRPTSNGGLDFGSTSHRVRNVYANTLDAGDLIEIGTQVNIRSSSSIQWSSTGSASGSKDLILKRDIANVLAQRNGTNAQEFRLYNTDDGAGNLERGALKWTGNVFKITTEASGTGTDRELHLESGDAVRVRVGGSNQLSFFGSGLVSFSDSFAAFSERSSEPSASADQARIYAEDDGAGKTRLMVKFGSGAAQQIAIEP